MIARILPVALAGVLLYFALRQVDLRELGTIAGGANLSYVALAWAIILLSQILRALRWRVIIHASGPVSALDAFWANSAGYFGNYVLPARAGEAIRSALGARAFGRPMGFILATAMTERIIDVPVLVLAAVVAATWLDAMPPEIAGALGVMGVASAGGVLGLAIAPRALGLLRRWLVRLPVISRHASRIDPHLERLAAGFTALHDWRRLTTYAALTAVVWSVDVCLGLVLAQALGVSLGVPLIMLLIAALGLSSALPSTPGYVGIYQVVALIVLVPFGYAPTMAIAYVVLLQALAYAVVLPCGLIGMWRLGGGLVTSARLERFTARK